MTSLAVEPEADLDQDYDWWAIQVVVREAKYMRLSRPELIIAVKLMREKGHAPSDIGDVLGISNQVATKIISRDEWPVPREVVLEKVKVGAKLPETGPYMSRRAARALMTGRENAKKQWGQPRH